MSWNSLPAILFVVLFVGGVVLIVVASGGQRKMWKERPSFLRALASRRGFQFIENPGNAEDLAPTRSWRAGSVKDRELPVAVRGRTADSQLTLFDVYSMIESGGGSHRSLTPNYETIITFKSAALRWPYFEFSAITHLKPGSFTGNLVSLIANATESISEKRGLKHIPIPEDPGCLLLAHDADHATVMRDALMKLFATREGWWLAAKDDSLTMVKSRKKSAAMRDFVPNEEVDRFVDEAIEIERSLRGLATPP